jgi:pimeloyl-ACP methyl ester carboxylesterase
VIGHSYGALAALLGALHEPDRIGKLVLYEPPRPDIVSPAARAALAAAADAGDHDGLALRFFAAVLHVPGPELAALRESPAWPPIVADAANSWQDARALAAWRLDVRDWPRLRVPVLLQVGEHSPRDLYLTDALATALPDVRVDTLTGEAHEAMTTAPEVWLASVLRFLRP